MADLIIKNRRFKSKEINISGISKKKSASRSPSPNKRISSPKAKPPSSRRRMSVNGP